MHTHRPWKHRHEPCKGKDSEKYKEKGLIATLNGAIVKYRRECCSQVYRLDERTLTCLDKILESN